MVAATRNPKLNGGKIAITVSPGREKKKQRRRKKKKEGKRKKDEKRNSKEKKEKEKKGKEKLDRSENTASGWLVGRSRLGGLWPRNIRAHVGLLLTATSG